MSVKLKPCPFCGGEAKLEHNGDYSIVMCSECNARSKGFHVTHEYSSDSKAIEAWNRRADNVK